MKILEMKMSGKDWQPINQTGGKIAPNPISTQSPSDALRESNLRILTLGLTPLFDVVKVNSADRKNLFEAMLKGIEVNEKSAKAQWEREADARKDAAFASLAEAIHLSDVALYQQMASYKGDSLTDFMKDLAPDIYYNLRIKSCAELTSLNKGEQ